MNFDVNTAFSTLLTYRLQNTRYSMHQILAPTSIHE